MIQLFASPKIKPIVLFFCTVFPVFIFSQTSKLDSLKSILNEQENDTLKVNILLQYADALTQQLDLEKSLYYYKLAKTLSDELNYPRGSVESNYGIGLYFIKHKHDPESALPYANRAINVSDSMHYLRLLNKSYRLKLNCYRQKGDFTKMKYFTLKCFQISRELNDSIGIGKAFADMGIILFIGANYDSAVIYYMKAIDIFENTGHEKLLGNTYINLAKVFVRTNDNNLAEKYLIRALSIEDKVWRRTYIPVVYDNLGLIYKGKKDYIKAVEFYNLGIRYAIESNYRSEYAYLLINKTKAQRELGLFSKGMENLRIALEISKEIGNKRIEYNVFSTRASIYVTQNEYVKAIDYYKSALIAIKDINVPKSYLTTYKNLFPIYETLGDYKNAFH